MWFVIGFAIVAVIALFAWFFRMLRKMDEAVKNEKDRFNRSARTYPHVRAERGEE